VRTYEARAASTDVFGRVLCTVRNHHFIIDGPKHNGCPGEEVTPSEMFLSAIASCGVELVQVLAKDATVPLRGIEVTIGGSLDRSKRARPDVTLFSAVRLHFQLKGVTDKQARQLVDDFKSS